MYVTFEVYIFNHFGDVNIQRLKTRGRVTLAMRLVKNSGFMSGLSLETSAQNLRLTVLKL